MLSAVAIIAGIITFYIKDVSDFFEKSRIKDKHIFSEYKKLSEDWAARIEAEQDGEIASVQ